MSATQFAELSPQRLAARWFAVNRVTVEEHASDQLGSRLSIYLSNGTANLASPCSDSASSADRTPAWFLCQTEVRPPIEAIIGTALIETRRAFRVDLRGFLADRLERQEGYADEDHHGDGDPEKAFSSFGGHFGS